jgi:pantoate--beta-alanine ligase
MKIIDNIKTIKEQIKQLKKEGKTIGFVPTMGFLHEGHLSLVRKSKSETDITVVSIFVNPTQFAPNEDLDKYPRDLERDCSLLEQEGVDILFFPNNKEMYPKGYETYVFVERLSKLLCGKSRPIHFRGVTTIVLKLFNIVSPDRAFFGQKDAQQAIIIKRMILDLNLDVNLRVLPIVREKDGLAMSSRNKYLTEDEREQAIGLFKALTKGKEIFDSGVKDVKIIKEEALKIFKKYPLLKLDYLEIVDISSLNKLEKAGEKAVMAIAAFLGKTRLIDNMILGGSNEDICS